MNHIKRNKGFTLAEIVIALSIIGILVGLAVPALSTSKQDAQRSKRIAITKAIESAKASYLSSDAGLSSYGSKAQFSEFQKYLNLNGSVIQQESLIKFQKNNGTGQDIVNYGRYPSAASLTSTNKGTTGLGDGIPTSWSSSGTKP
jgi:prepilin-type N-terminal cleavage/methylation domain-containing protein